MVADARGLGVATLWRREVSELIAKDARVGGVLSPDGEGTWGVSPGVAEPDACAMPPRH